ncbi:MAG: PRC-barrel domain-containing protein [Candidatus Marsarchaeota archaeon]|nr:PRC-barrel domain-containing protein [Candidatus Marsarchaeota archaeon]
MLLSDMYGKQIISSGGRRIGMVEDIILDFEAGAIGSLLLIKLDELAKGENTATRLAKNTVKYDRVKNVSETIIVSDK